ncbi:MAG TPA: GspMb/PilO family protein [Gammaproteobacteria bacterium]|nr:GspMb/PilO family protein [Gammaproteobacteria bacterium]
MNNLLARLDPKRLPLLAGGITLLACVTLSVYLVLPQYRTWRAASTERDGLELSVQAAPSVAAEHLRLVGEVQALETALRGDAGSMPEQALEAFVIGRLQDLSWRRGVDLVSVQPMPPGTVGAIRETTFQLELEGGYAELRAWLGDIGGELGFVTIRQLALVPQDGEGDDPRLRAALILAAYRSAT